MPQTGKHEVVGLIGLGLVGSAIAENLLARGYHVVGFDIDPAQCGAHEKRGGITAKNLREVAEKTTLIILSLMTTETVCQVIEGEDGLLSGGKVPSLIIDTTTGTPDDAMALAERLKQKGITYLDAPISGSSQQIRDREALFMVGGEQTTFASNEALFDAIANQAFYVGPSGSGAKAKLASNLILGLNRLVLAEGLVFAEKMELDLTSFLTLLKVSPAYSVAMDIKGEKMLAGDFSPQAKVSQHHKDLQIILDCAASAGQELPLAQVHQHILQGLITVGDGELDNSAVYKALRQVS